MPKKEIIVGQSLLDNILLGKLNQGIIKPYNNQIRNDQLELLPLIMFFGLAGAGKSTIWNLAKNYLNCQIIKITTLTNRPMRFGEAADSREWHNDIPNQKLLDLDDLQYRKYVLDFLEKKDITMLELDIRETGYFYGVSLASFNNALKEARFSQGLVFLEIEVRGLKFILDFLKSQKQSILASIFITNPSFEKMYHLFKDDRDYVQDRLEKNIAELKQVPELASEILINYDNAQEEVAKELASFLDAQAIKFYQQKAL